MSDASYAKSDESKLMFFNLFRSNFIHTCLTHVRAHSQLYHPTRATHMSRDALSDPFCKVLVDGQVKGQTFVQEQSLNNPGVCGGGVC